MFIKKLFALILTLLIIASSAFAYGEKSNADEYDDAVKLLQENKYTEAAKALAAIGNYSDAPQLAMYCYAIAAGEAGLYSAAVTNLLTLGAFRDAPLLAQYYTARSYEEAELYESALDIFANMTLYRDVAVRLETYPEKINARDYANAEAAENAGKLEQALSAFKALGSYMDSAERAKSVQNKIDKRSATEAEVACAAAYAAANKAEQNEDYVAAYSGFSQLGDYLDSAARAAAIHDKTDYAQAMQFAMAGKYAQAYSLFAALAEKDYADSAEKEYVLSITSIATVSDRKNGIAAFKFMGQWGLINVNTNKVISPLWDEIGEFTSFNLATVKKDGLIGYINSEGEVIIPCSWYAVSEFNKDGICTVVKKLAKALVTTKKTISTLAYTTATANR